jgi:hypothetical protein
MCWFIMEVDIRLEMRLTERAVRASITALAAADVDVGANSMTAAPIMTAELAIDNT